MFSVFIPILAFNYKSTKPSHYFHLGFCFQISIHETLTTTISFALSMFKYLKIGNKLNIAYALIFFGFYFSPLIHGSFPHSTLFNIYILYFLSKLGLLDNVLSDYLWAKAVLLTSTTVATAGLTIQVPLAAIVDTITGHSPPFMDYLGAIAVMIGFAGINIPADTFSKSTDATAVELKIEDVSIRDEEHALPRTQDSAAVP
jgi:drug/metabolite transporter (DMT)-like permease